MLEFDSAALTFAQSNGGTYLRYCDDMLFLMPLGMKGPTEAFVMAELKALEVDINADKTDSCDFTLREGDNRSRITRCSISGSCMTDSGSLFDLPPLQSSQAA